MTPLEASVRLDVDMTTRRHVLTKARQRFISALAKNLIVVVVAAVFGGDLLFKFAGVGRVWFIVVVTAVVLVLLAVGVWLAVDDEEKEP